MTDDPKAITPPGNSPDDDGKERILWYCGYGPNDRLLASVGVHVDDPDALRDNPFPPEIPIYNIVLSQQSRDDYEHGLV